MILTLPLPPKVLRDSVSAHLPWATHGEWVALFGGRTNCAWHVTGQDATQSAVLKLYRAPARNPLFPNDPAAEAALLDHLATTNIAPQLIANFQTEIGTCNLYQAIPGTPWSSGVTDVANLMQRLHAIAPPSGLRQSPNGSDAILAHADKILSMCHSTAALHGLRPKGTVPPTDHPALLHCDIVPGNLIQNETGLHLIDWQCPAIGDPAEDIAVFLSPAMQILYRGEALQTSDVNQFLDTQEKAQAIRHRMLAPFYHYRMAAYCLWQSQNDRPDYAEGYAAECAALQAC